MSDLLELMAQLAITIAALSAVAGATQSSSQTKGQNYLLRDVAVIGLAVALYSFLPLLMLEGKMPIGLALLICGSLAALSWATGYALYIFRIWGDWQQFDGMFFLGLFVTIAGVLFFTSNIYESSTVAYLCGLLCWLGIACLNFITSVFSPRTAA